MDESRPCFNPEMILPRSAPRCDSTMRNYQCLCVFSVHALIAQKAAAIC